MPCILISTHVILFAAPQQRIRKCLATLTPALGGRLGLQNHGYTLTHSTDPVDISILRQAAVGHSILNLYNVIKSAKKIRMSNTLPHPDQLGARAHGQRTSEFVPGPGRTYSLSRKLEYIISLK